MAGDVLIDLLRKVRAELPGIAPERWAAIEAALRAEHGGSEHYIARRAKSTLLQRMEQALEADASLSNAQLSSQLGITVRHAQRLRRLVR